eukprot:c6471_g2_i1 orf=174-407(+)
MCVLIALHIFLDAILPVFGSCRVCYNFWLMMALFKVFGARFYHILVVISSVLVVFSSMLNIYISGCMFMAASVQYLL